MNNTQVEQKDRGAVALLSSTWTWGILMVLALGLLATAFYWSYSEHQRQYLSAYQSRQQQYTQLIAKATTAKIQHLFDDLELLAGMESIINLDESGIHLLEHKYNQKQSSIHAATRITEEMQIEYTIPDHSSIGADLSGQVHNRWMVQNQQKMVSDPFMAVQGYKAVSLAVPVFDQERFTGSLAFLVDFTELTGKTSDMSDDNYRMDVWLVDHSGVILQSPYLDQVEKKVSELFPQRREVLKQIYEPGTGSGSFTLNGGFEPGSHFDETKVIGSFSELPLTENNKWYVFVFTPKAEVIGAFPAARLPFLVAALFIAVFVAGSVVVIRALGKYRSILEHDVRLRTAELESSRSRYIHLINGMSEGIASSDEHGVFTVVNPALERIVGVEPDTLIGKKIAEFLDSGQMPVLLYHHRMRQEKKSSSYELRIKRPDGEIRTLWVSGSPITDPEGQYRGATTFIQDITDQKVAEESLRQERSMFIEGPVVVFKLSAGEELLVEYVSPNVSQFGYSPKDLTDHSRSFLGIVHEEDRDLVLKDFRDQEERGNQSFEQEFRLLSSSGKKIWVHVFTSILRDDEGEATNFIGYLIDNSERKRSELTQQVLHSISEAHSRSSGLEDLAESIRNHLGQLIDTTNFYVALYDEQKKLYEFPYYADEHDTDFEPQSLEYSLTDYVRRTGYPLYSNEETHNKLLKSGDIRTIGPMSPVWLGVPLRTNSGIIGVVAVQSYASTDTYGPDDLELLTYVSDHIAIAIERKQAETALRKSEETHRRLIEVMQEGIVTVDENEIITFANDYYCSMVGYPMSSIVGRNIIDMVDEESAKKIKAGTGQKKERQNSTYEIRHKTESGEYRDFLVSSAPVYNDLGAYEGAIGVLVDITDRKKSQETLQHTQKLESLGVLAGGIAHDFSNLLVGIIGNAELARSEAEAGGNVSEFIRDIERAAQRAAELTRQMLAYSGRGKFVVEPVDLGEIATEMGQLLEAAIPKDVRVEYELEEDTPLISADATQVRQVVMNLILNGAEAIGDRPGIVRIKVGSVVADAEYLSSRFLVEELPEGRYVFLDVSDNGHGMDEDTINRIFDPFFTTKFTGRGLGLAAVLGIVRGHNGTLRVYSEPGKGSRFKVLFPELPGTTGEAEGTDGELSETKMSGRILLVDDEPSIRKVGEKILTRAGFIVDCAHDGIEGVEKFRQYHSEYRLVVLDITMPRMGGDEAYREMLSINPSIRVLLTSGYDEQDVSTRFTGRKLAGFIQKPFNSESLLSKIRAILDQ